MTSPIADFISSYINSGTRRLHMPGHKGTGPLGFEQYDITEIKGADALYEADGIIAESETNAASIFGTGRTLYSTEGSSQCIRAMLYLAVTQRPAGTSAAVLAARNVHKAFIYAAALVGFDVEWLFPDEHTSICACPVAPAALDKKLSEMETTPAAVYVTSPDYLGGMQDIKALAEVCHKHGTLLIVDNAHGAYLHFTEPAMHPMDLGADICCDSATRHCPCSPAAHICTLQSTSPPAMPITQSRPWRSSAPPAPAISYSPHSTSAMSIWPPPSAMT